MRTLLLLCTVLLGLNSVSWAQPASEPKTLSDCVQAVQEYPNQQLKAARAAGQKPNYAEIQQGKQALARRLVAQFRMEDVAPGELRFLASLHRDAGQPEQAIAAITRAVAATTISPRDLADTLVIGVGLLVAGEPTSEKLAEAEAYVARLDAMGDEFLPFHLRARSRLAGYYGYADIDAPNLAHNEKILALLKKLRPEHKSEFGFLAANAYDRIALVHANRGAVDKAIAVLEQGKAEVTDARQRKAIEDTLARYALVGQPGAPLKGDYWLNTNAKELAVRGKVTLIQFTAHWCGPCRKSYPAMMKFHERYGKDGLQVVYSTELYGFFDKQQNLSPEAEMAANREYYLGHYKTPFPVSVQARAERQPNEAPNPNLNGTQYRVGGIPQIVLLDRDGIVRMLMIGWDPANEERTSKLIEALLHESPKTAKK